MQISIKRDVKTIATSVLATVLSGYMLTSCGDSGSLLEQYYDVNKKNCTTRMTLNDAQKQKLQQQISEAVIKDRFAHDILRDTYNIGCDLISNGKSESEAKSEATKHATIMAWNVFNEMDADLPWKSQSAESTPEISPENCANAKQAMKRQAAGDENYTEQQFNLFKDRCTKVKFDFKE